MASSTRFLRTYLNAHRGGAIAGASLARRLRDQAPDQAQQQTLQALAAQIEADRAFPRTRPEP